MLLLPAAQNAKRALVPGSPAADAAALFSNWLRFHGLGALGEGLGVHGAASGEQGDGSRVLGIVDGLTDEAAESVVMLLLQQEKLVRCQTFLVWSC